MKWQTYYKDAEGHWCQSVLLENMTLSQAEDWVINCDDVYDLGYKIEEAQ